MRMIHRRTLVAAAAAAAYPMPASPAEAGSAPVRQEWHDPARDRSLPMLIRLPAGTAPAPVVLVTHGLGGTREGLAYLGKALAAAGYVSVHVQHPGTDASVWQGAADARLAMIAAAMDASRALDRLHDAAFVLDELERRAAADAMLGGRIDMRSVAVAGHSYGAWTVLHLLGQRLPVADVGLRLPDPRLRAGIALSPIPPMGLSPAQAYAPVRAPILYVTGTRDQGWGVGNWRQRTLGYQNSTGPAALAILDGAAHASFAGEAVAGGYWNQPTYQARTAQLGVLFLRAVLDGSQAARAALAAGGGLQPEDRLEVRGLA